MRSILRTIALPLGFATLLIGAWSWASVQEQEVTLDVQHVRGSVYMVTGRGGNLGVSVGPDGVLLIDDQFAALAPKIQASLDELAREANLEGGAPRYLINTHHHGDHTGGNPKFGPAATIIAHENVRARLIDPPQGVAMAAAGLPVITFEDALALHFNGERIQLMHLEEGHTDGDTVIYFSASNVMHTGDQCFNGLFPVVDLSSGGSVSGYIRNLEALLADTDEETLFIPGHGPLATRADVDALRVMLSGVVSRISGALQNGQSARDMKDAGLLDEFDSWSWSFISTHNMIDLVMAELTGR